MSHSEYDDALNLIAAALSRLLPIYTFDKRTGRPVSRRLSLATGRFRDGATAYESRRGRKAMTALMVRREHLPAAMNLIRATGIPFFHAETER